MKSENNSFIGKRVGRSVYVHKDAIHLLNDRYNELYKLTIFSLPDDFDHNVIKFEGSSVSLLSYEDFSRHAFPSLLRSVYFDLKENKIRYFDFSKRDNPPILHRKELLLPRDHHLIPEFSAITKLAESYGLFKDKKTIGLKKKWLDLVASAGLRIDGPRLIEKNQDNEIVFRHRTALSRRDLSQPVQLLLSNGVLDHNLTFFDYGCGQGTDFSILQSNGFKAFGWDPFHLPHGKRDYADVVNLGFVLNVIEDQHERLETLKSAWHFSRKALCISVMISGKIDLGKFRKYRDGILTSRNTFQKYFNQQELRDYIASATGQMPIALGSGIIIVFKDKFLEQDVLFKRNNRYIDHFKSLIIPKFSKLRLLNGSLLLKTLVEEELSAAWNLCMSHGRTLKTDELPNEIIRSLGDKNISFRRFLNLLNHEIESNAEFKLYSVRRKEDLIVNLASSLFLPNNSYNQFSTAISRDIKFHFGSVRKALQVSRDFLFSTGNPVIIKSAVTSALKQNIGSLKDPNTFRFRRDNLDMLPIELRMLVLCAGTLRGGIDGVDLIDLKIDSPRVNLITCLNFDGYFPLISEINRVDLGRLKSQIVFPAGKIIYWKSRYMFPKEKDYLKQVGIDKKLFDLGIINETGDGPDILSLKKILRHSP
jgi:DNA phosphorothioation-associated putative methyltransferase